MTIEEMRNKIKNVCKTYNLDDCRIKCPLRNHENCYNNLTTDEEIKRNYKIMFEKEDSKMKNEFDFNELKAGWAIKLPNKSLCVGVQTNENEITFFERFDNGDLIAVCTKEDIINNKCRNEHEISFYPIEIYGYSKNYELFDINTRPLIWKKEEDANFKIYKIGDLEIKPNYDHKTFDCDIPGYKTDKEDFLFIENTNEEVEYITIRKSELNDIINALTEIRDFIKED